MEIISGIYVIRNIIDKKVYVGSSSTIVQRWYRHRSQLRLDMHHNALLQRSWNKYGEDCFQFEIIEQCDKTLLSQYEEHWIELLHSAEEQHGYNLSRFTDKPFLGKRHSLETRKKMSENHRCTITQKTRELWKVAMKGKKLSDITKQRISSSNKGKHKHSPEIIEASRQRALNRSPEKTAQGARTLYKRYVVTNPDGIEFHILGLKPFCLENGLHDGNMVSVANGKLKHYKGWKCRKV